MAGNFFDPRPQYRLDSGAVCAGGTLYFYEANSTTPQDVYSDPGLDPGDSLGPTVELDSAGRTPTDVFLDNVAYNVELRDADDVQVWLAENVNVQAAASATMPDPSTGDEDDVLSTDGVDALWRAIREVPDPTGQTGKYLGTDGELVQWTAFPATVEYDADNLPGGIEATPGASGSVVIGGVMFQWGADTAPSAAAVVTTKSVTFGTAFSGTPYSVQVTPTSAGVTSDNPPARVSAQALSASATDFTASFFAGAEDEGNGSTNITSSVNFTWVAVGPAPA